MKLTKQKVFDILKKYEFIHKDMTISQLTKIKNFMYTKITWKQYMELIFLGYYLSDKLPDEGIFIEELNFQLGGLVNYDIHKGITDCSTKGGKKLLNRTKTL